MSSQTLLWALFVCSSFVSFCHSSRLSPAQKKTGCFKVNSCKCVMKDGSGVISLKGMGDKEGFLGRLRPVSMESAEEVLLSFSPCLPFSVPELVGVGECTNVAACLYIRSPVVSRYLSYGRHDGNEFHYNNSLKVLTVSYFAENKQPLTVVHYQCNPNQSASFIQSLGLSAEGPLHIWVDSPCACPNACAMGDLGLGTIFLILLSVSATAYFILGCCALRPFRSSSGVQISPEHSVWCMICYLCSESKPRRQRYTDVAHCEG